jgi:hypothetical protein
MSRFGLAWQNRVFVTSAMRVIGKVGSNSKEIVLPVRFAFQDDACAKEAIVGFLEQVVR